MAGLLDACGSAATGGSSQHRQDHHDVQHLVNVLAKAWAQIFQWNDPAASNVLLLNLARGAAESARDKLNSPRRAVRTAPLAAVTMAQGSYYSHAARHTQEARHKHDLQAWQLIAAGAVARAVAQVASYPLDTLKTRLQVTASNSQLVAWQQALAASSRSVQLGPLQLKVANAVQAGGIGSLYRGVAGAAVACLPAALLFFATDAACKHLLARHKAAQRHSTRSTAEGPSMLHHMLSSCSAALVSAFVRVPGDVCKHRVQAFAYPSLAEAAHSIWRSKGPAGLFCGFTATLVRDVPEMAIQFTLYEALRKAHAAASQDGAPAGGLGTLLMGGLAGAAASALTTPLDVIKSQMQCQGQTSAVGALHNVLLQRGLPGLMSGVGPRVAQSALTMAVFFTLYEALKSRILLQQPLAGRSSAAHPMLGQQHPHQQRQQWRAAPLMPALVVRLRDAAPQYPPAHSHHMLDMAVPLQHHL